MKAGILVALASILVALAGVGCGGGGDGEGETQTQRIPPSVLAKAEANCRYFLREIKQIGAGSLVREDPGMNNLELTTEHLVRPSVPLLERIAARQQALQPAARNYWFDLYAEIFDPIVALAKQRLASGAAGNYFRSRDLEDLLTSRGLEQMDAARNAGLSECDVDFQNVLLSSLSE